MVVYTKSHKKYLKEKTAHHVSIHEENDGHVEIKGKIPKEHKEESAMTWKIATFALAILLILSIFTQGFSSISFQQSTTGQVTKTTDKGVVNKLPIELYVMSECPYGTQAEDTLFAAVQDIGEQNFDLHVDYIANNANGQFTSLHGNNEVQGDIAQLCAKDVDETKYLDLILCMNKDASKIPDNWEACAESVGYDVATVKKCYEGDKGKELLADSITKSTARGATGSPTIYVGDSKYSGGRQTLDFKRAFCNGFEGTKPQTCSDVPEAKKFEMILLNDKTCSSCDTSNIVPATKNFFPGVQIREVDVNSKEGKDLVDKYAIELVPTYIFSKDMEETQAWKNTQFQGNFDKLSDGSYKLKDTVTGASFFIDEKKRAARLADMGITTGDNKPQIDFFVMSFCPYGNQAEDQLIDTYKAMKDVADFKPHYIYYENYQGGGPNYCLDNESKYCSMHGATEAREDIREQCVAEKYGIDAWFNFATAMNSNCDSKNADTCYVDVAKNLGYDTDYIASCEKENELVYPAEDVKLMQLFGATGSPAIYIDGATYNGARTASGYQAALCKAFKDAPAECDNIVQDTTSQTASAPAGSCG